MGYPEYLIGKKGNIVSSRLTEKWFQENKKEIYEKIEKEVKLLFPSNYKAKTYSEYLYVYYNKLSNEHICNNPKCNNVSVFKKMGVGFLDYCSKKCRGEHIRINKDINKEKDLDKKRSSIDKTLYNKDIRKDLDIIFYKDDGKLDSNKFRESWLKKHRKDMYESIVSIKEDIPFKEKLYLYLFEKKEIPSCKTCGKRLSYKGTITKGYGKYCNNICSSKDIEMKEISKKNYIASIKKKYGKGHTSYFQTDEFKEKLRETSLKKYGTEYISQSDTVKKKIYNTINERYGSKKELGKLSQKKSIITLKKKYGKDINSYMDLDFLKEKIKKTNLKRYGFENTLCSGSPIRKKIEETNKKKYGGKSPFSSPVIKRKAKIKIFNKIKKRISKDINYNITEDEFLKKGIYSNYLFECNKCKNKFYRELINNTYKTIWCKKCKPRNTSKYELEISDFLKKEGYNKEILNNDKTILKGKEIDIYIPDRKLGIEYNGLMFHSVGISKYSMFNNYYKENIIRQRHLEKTNNCLEKGIELLHIFENEWKDEIKRNIWKSIIKTKLGYNERIYGRNTYIKIVSNELSKEFLYNNHLQGNIGSSVKIGLFSKTRCFNKNGDKIIEKDELISIMTFGKSRYGNEEWEILRYANKLGLSVIGGASKIFKYFLNNYVLSGESIKTYADLRFSQGDIYKKLGFKFLHNSNPNYFYFKENTLYLESRVKYQKHKLKNILEKFDENLTGSENMYSNGYRKIYDCGNAVFVFRKD